MSDHLTDLRPLVTEVEDEVRRRRLRTAVPSLAVLGTLGLLFAAGGLVEPGLAVLGLVLLSFVGLCLVAAVLRHRTGSLPLRPERVDAGPASTLRRGRGPFVAGMGVLALVAAGPLAVAVLAATSGRTGLAVVTAAVGTALAWPVVAAVLGRYVAGDLVLGRAGLRFRQLGLESSIRWDEIAAVEVDEPSRRVVLDAVAGSAARHRVRALPKGRRRPLDGSLVLELRDWGPLATDVGRLVLHYAEDAADRVELGTPAAGQRWQLLATLPVHVRRDRWRVGGRDDDGPPRASELAADAGRPLWEDSVDESVQRSMLGFYAGRLQATGGAVLMLPAMLSFTGVPSPWGLVSGLGFVLAGLVALSLAFVEPRPPGLAAVHAPQVATIPGAGVVLRRSPARLRLWVAVQVGLAVGVGAALLGSVQRAPVALLVLGGAAVIGLIVVPALVVTGAVVPRELRLDESGLTHRSGRRRHAVAWDELARVDADRDDVVRLALRDGRVLRIDVGGTAASGRDVALLLQRYLQDGPRGETRDVAAVRRTLDRGR